MTLHENLNTSRFISCKLVLTYVICFFAKTLAAQFYPVQVTPQLVPPYSVYLSDYATPGNEKLRVIILQRDLTQPAYQLRLVMNVELNGRVIMRTARNFNAAPLNLEPGVPTIISGIYLAPYLNSRNIDFVGYSREQYEKTRALPEGGYRIIFTAYDFRRQDVQVSNEGSSFCFLSKNEPPLINFPACGTKIPVKEPQQIIFSWLPRNTSSPNSAAETEYEFSLYETRPEGRSPNDVVLSTQPVFRVRTDFPQLVYGPAEPMLIENMKYVWRAQTIDKNGRDAFRNNGYSEVCAFTYGGVDQTFDIGVVKNLQAVGETESRAKISWEASNYDGYRVNYKKTGSGYEWFHSDLKTSPFKLFGLEADTEYETRVQVKKSGVFGPYSEIIKFRTTPKRVIVCGQPNDNLTKADESKPLQAAHKGMTIDADGMPITLTEVFSLSAGYFRGIGTTTTKLLSASFHVKFERLFIDENHVAGFGRIEFVTRGVAELVQQQMVTVAINDKKNQQKSNRDQWSEQLFHEKIFKYDAIIITDIHFEDGVLVITDSEGNTFPNKEVAQLLADAPEKAIIIEDKNGDQWVVQKGENGESKVTKVEGGGLVVGEDGKIIAEKNLNDLYNKILAALRKYKKAIEDYQATIKQTQPSKGGGPSLSQEEIEMLFAELPDCLASSKEKLGEVSSNIENYLEITSSISLNFYSIISKALEPEFPTEVERYSAPVEKVEGAVCEALAAPIPCLGFLDSCDDVVKKLELIRKAYSESGKLTGRIPYSAANRVLNGKKIKVEDFEYNLISIQFEGSADKDYSVNPKSYIEYDETIKSVLGGTIRQRGFAFKDGDEIVMKILVFEEDEEKFNASKETLRKYLFGNDAAGSQINSSKKYELTLIAKTAELVAEVLSNKFDEESVCNYAVRDAFYSLTGEACLFPEEGSFCYKCNPEKYIKGETTNPGRANHICDDLGDNKYKKFTLLENIADPNHPDSQIPNFALVQELANNGYIVIGAKRKETGSGHVVIVVPGELFLYERQNKTKDKYHVPVVLDCGVGEKFSKVAASEKWKNQVINTKWYLYKP